MMHVAARHSGKDGGAMAREAEFALHRAPLEQFARKKLHKSLKYLLCWTIKLPEGSKMSSGVSIVLTAFFLALAVLAGLFAAYAWHIETRSRAALIHRAPMYMPAFMWTALFEHRAKREAKRACAAGRRLSRRPAASAATI